LKEKTTHERDFSGNKLAQNTYLVNMRNYLRFGVRAARTALLISRRFLVFFDREVLFLVFVAIRFAMGVLYTRNYFFAN
jgi:hypothetical protein